MGIGVRELFQLYYLRDPPYSISVHTQRLVFLSMFIRKRFPVQNRDRAPWSSPPEVVLSCLRHVGGVLVTEHPSPDFREWPPSRQRTIVEMIAMCDPSSVPRIYGGS